MFFKCNWFVGLPPTLQEKQDYLGEAIQLFFSSLNTLLKKIILLMYHTITWYQLHVPGAHLLSITIVPA